MSKRGQKRPPGTGPVDDGGSGGVVAPGKRTLTQGLPPAAVGPSTHRVQVTPPNGKFALTEIGHSRNADLMLTNKSSEPLDFFDFLATILPTRGDVARPKDGGDFAVVGGTTTADGIAPGESMPISVAFTPKASHPDDLKKGKKSERKSRFDIIDREGAVAGSFKLRGHARAPSADTIDEGATAEIKSAVRRSASKLPPPKSFDEMRHHLIAARDLIQTAEREDADELVGEVSTRMYEALRYDQVLQAFRSYGLGTQSATMMVAHAHDQVVGASVRLNGSMPVDMDYVLTSFEVAKEPIQLTLGEIDHAASVRAMHDASPAVLAGKGAVELGKTAKRILTDAAFAGGFGLGVLEGSGGAIKDLATGLVDVLEIAFDIARAMVTGGLIGAAIDTAGKVDDFFDSMPMLLNSMGNEFKDNWTQSDSFGCGNFRGEVIGYIAAQIALIIISGGAAAEGVAFAAMSRWGKVVKIIQTLDNAGDIVAWASKAGRGLNLPRKILDRIRDARKGATVRVDAPQGSGPHVPGSPDAPHGTSDPSPSVKDAHGGDADGLHADDDVDVPADRTRPPYGDPNVDPTGPRRPLDKRELVPHRKLDVKKSWKEIDRAQKSGDLSFAVGAKLKSADDGHDILARLSRGDASALEKIGITDYPKDLDPTGREWALIEVRDGFAIYAGGYRKVDLPANARVLGHTHPGPEPSVRDPDRGPDVDRRLNAGADGRPFAEVLDDLENARNSGIVPSAADINAISDGTPHVLYTRYVHGGDGKVANPLPNDARPRVQVHMHDAKVVRWNPRRRSYYYEVRVVVRDASGHEIWSGKMYAAWHAQLPGGDTFVKRPALLDRPASPEWQAP